MRFLFSLIIIAIAWYGLQFVPRPSGTSDAAPSEYASVNQQLNQLMADSQAAQENNASAMNSLTKELGIANSEKMVSYETISPMQKITEKMSAGAEQTGSSMMNAVNRAQIVIENCFSLLRRINSSIASSLGLFTIYLVALRLLRLWPALRFAASSGMSVGKTALIALALASIGTQWFSHDVNLWALRGLVFLSAELFIAGMVGLILLDMNYPWRKTLIGTAFFPLLSLVSMSILPMVR